MPFPILLPAVKGAIAAGVGGGITGLIQGVIGRAAGRNYDPYAANAGTNSASAAALQAENSALQRELLTRQIGAATQLNTDTNAREGALMQAQSIEARAAEERGYQHQIARDEAAYAHEARMLMLQSYLEQTRMQNAQEQANGDTARAWEPGEGTLHPGGTGVPFLQRLLRSIGTQITGTDPGPNSRFWRVSPSPGMTALKYWMSR